MDRVRLGRVLGRGARMAARTVYEAVDAATASPAAGRPAASVEPATLQAARSPAHKQHQAGSVPLATSGRHTAQQAVQAAQRLHGSTRKAKQGMLAPVKRASRALTLEMSGSFFGLFALSFAVAVWRTLHTAGGEHGKLGVYGALALLFAYFSITSFLRARRIQRG